MSFNAVLGGIDTPKFTLLQQNLVTNRYFDGGLTTGWSETAGGILTTLVQDDAYGEFMGNVSSADETVKAQWIETISSGFAVSRTWMASFRAKTPNAGTQTLFSAFITKDGVPLVNVDLTLIDGSEVGRYIIMATTSFSAPGTIAFEISGSPLAGGGGTVRLDHVLFAEVIKTIVLPQPITTGGEQSFLRFEEDAGGQNELWSGAVQKFGQRWRPFYAGRWQFLSKEDEVLRQELSQAELIFCQPHEDIDWGFLGIWKNDFSRRYSFNRYLGHNAIVEIEGVEFLKEPFSILDTVV